jgi:hypothetical protein
MIRYLFVLTVTFLFPWGALSDERMGLSFVCAAGPCQRSLYRVLVPWDLRPHVTVSDLRLPFSSPPTTRRVTVEVFDPASTWVLLNYLSLSLMLWPTVSRPVCLGIKHLFGLTTRFLLPYGIRNTSPSRILLYSLCTDHAQKTQTLYCCMAETTQKIRVTCQTASSLVC